MSFFHMRLRAVENKAYFVCEWKILINKKSYTKFMQKLYAIFTHSAQFGFDVSSLTIDKEVGH